MSASYLSNPDLAWMIPKVFSSGEIWVSLGVYYLVVAGPSWESDTVTLARVAANTVPGSVKMKSHMLDVISINRTNTSKFIYMGWFHEWFTITPPEGSNKIGVAE